MQDLQKILNKEFAKYFDTKFEETLQKHIASMMDSCLQDLFRSYGDDTIGKAVTKQLKDSLNINLGDKQLMQYNGMIANSLGGYFKDLIDQRNLKPILTIIDGIVGKPSDAEIDTLDNLFDEIRGVIERIIEDDYHRKGDDQDKSYSIYADYNKTKGWINVYCDDEMEVEKDDCSIKFIIGKSSNSIFSVSFGSSERQVKRYFDPLEAYINNLYLSGVIIKEINWDKLEDGDLEVDCGEYSSY